MNTYFIVTLISVVACFLLPAVVFNISAQQQLFNRSSSLKNSVFLPIFTILLVCALAGYFMIYSEDDFINSLNIIEVTFPLIGALIIYLSGYTKRFSKYSTLIVFLCVAGSVFTVNDSNMSFLSEYNPLINRLATLAAWFIFSLAYKYTNSGDGMLPIQSLSILCGIAILAVIGALPVFIGFLAAVSAAAFIALLIFTWHPSRIKISETTAMAFGFMIFGLIAFSSYEGSASCMLILCSFMIVDTVWAVGHKLTFIAKYKNIINNTAYRQALDDGMNPAQAAAFSFRIQILLVLFAAIQAFSPNDLSLVLLSFFITVWFCYKFRTIPAPSKSLKSINLQVIEDLQERVRDIKDIVTKDDKD